MTVPRAIRILTLRVAALETRVRRGTPMRIPCDPRVMSAMRERAALECVIAALQEVQGV